MSTMKTSKESLRVVVVGGVAAGPKVAARILRLNPDAEVTVIERGEKISYAGCGLPYFVSDTVKEEAELRSTPIGVVRDPLFFEKVKDFKVRLQTEALDIDTEGRRLQVRSVVSGDEEWLAYDKLVLCTGASPFSPPLPGLELPGVFRLQKIEDAEGIKAMLGRKIKKATIIGAGLIGVEMAESLTECGVEVTMVEMMPTILPGILDTEMANMVEMHMKSKGVRLMTATRVEAIEGDSCVQRVKTDQGSIDTDLVLVSIGVRPNVELAKNAGLDIGPTGGIRTNYRQQTSNEHILAAGDCCENRNMITGEPCFVPLGSTANKQGRVVANVICGMTDEFPGVLGSGVCRVFDFTVARTGLSEAQAIKAGYDVEWTIVPGPDKPHFMPDAKLIIVKLIADRKTRKLLGTQVVGPGECAKRADVAATAITGGLTVDQLANVDLCYAPPFSPAMDNIITAADAIRNKLDGLVRGMKPQQVKEWFDAGRDFTMLDVRSPGEYQQMRIEGAIHIPLGKVRSSVDAIARDKPVVIFCKSHCGATKPHACFRQPDSKRYL